MNDKLINIFKEQKDFQKNFYDIDNMSLEEKVLHSKEFILCAHRELGEILNELPWKSHRRLEPTEIDEIKIREEIIDSFKFILNLCIIWGMDSIELEKLFFEKSKIVRERFKKEYKK